jgi:DNA helicase-2/ATP-dependent DNA helicase PcrA
MLHGQTRFNLPSRFFQEMPEDSLKWISPPPGSNSPALWGSAPGAYQGSGSADRRYAPSGKGHHSSDAKHRGSDDWSANQGVALRPKLPVHTTALGNSAGGDGANDWVRVGQRVFHNKFGEGSVLALEGMAGDARAQIDFPRHGVKWLALSIAKLTPI